MIRPRITINCRLINKVSLGNCLARHTQLSLHYIIRITVHAISNYSMLLSRLITEEIFRDRMESSPVINVTGPCQESTSLPPIVYCISIKRGGRERLREWCVLEILASFIAILHLKALYPNKGFPISRFVSIFQDTDTVTAKKELTPPPLYSRRRARKINRILCKVWKSEKGVDRSLQRQTNTWRELIRERRASKRKRKRQRKEKGGGRGEERKKRKLR